MDIQNTSIWIKPRATYQLQTICRACLQVLYITQIRTHLDDLSVSAKAPQDCGEQVVEKQQSFLKGKLQSSFKSSRGFTTRDTVYRICVCRCMGGENYRLYICIGNVSCSISSVFTEQIMSQPPRGCVFFMFAQKLQDTTSQCFTLVWCKCSLNFLLMLRRGVDKLMIAGRLDEKKWQFVTMKNVFLDYSHILTCLISSCHFSSKIFFPVSRRFCVVAMFSRYISHLISSSHKTLCSLLHIWCLFPLGEGLYTLPLTL